MDVFNILALQPRPYDITSTKISLFKYICVHLETGQNKIDALKMLGQIMKFYRISPDRMNCKPLKQKKTAKEVLFALSEIGINEHGYQQNLNSFITTFLSYEFTKTN